MLCVQQVHAGSQNTHGGSSSSDFYAVNVRRALIQLDVSMFEQRTVKEALGGLVLYVLRMTDELRRVCRMTFRQVNTTKLTDGYSSLSIDHEI